VLRLIKNGASAENTAAESLRHLINKAWPDVEADPHCDIRIMTGVYLSGQKVDDLDIVLLAVFERPREITLVDNAGAIVSSYMLGSLCAVIEVKSHRYESVEMLAGAVWVTYDGQQKDVTKQSRDQMHSLARFLEAAGAGRPHITRFIFLENVSSSELRGANLKGQLPHEIITRDSTWENILFSIWRGWRGRNPEARGFAENKYFISADISRHTPADFNLISETLTNEEMSLQPFRYDDLRAPPTSTRPTVNLDRPFTNRRASKFPFTIKYFLLALVLMTAVGLIAVIFIPRLLLWGQRKESIAKPTGDGVAYAGRYRCPSNSEILITLIDQGDRLRLKSARGVVDLYPNGPDEFKAASANTIFQGRVRFTRTPGGQVTKLSMLPGQEKSVTCVRIP
jgi:hypothetical protein